MIKKLASTLAVRFLPTEAVKHLGRTWMRIENWLKYGDSTFPHHITIEIGERCNRSCEYCAQSLGRLSPKAMTDEVFMCSLQRLADIEWSGPVAFHVANEPLLDKRLVEKVQAAKDVVPGCIPTIVTNGDALTVEKAEALIDAGVGRIMISRHAPFSQAWDERIGEILLRWPGICQMTQVGVTIERHKNAQWTDEGLDWQGRCIAPSLNLVITVSGEVSLCCCDFNRTTNFGSITEKSILEIWHGATFTELRRRLRDGQRDLPICNGCSGVI
jgi:MoaA/NifB/PqqE/SkfB family radical SAM enzyme